MYEKCQATLKMTRAILQDSFFDKNTYECQVITYNPAKECIYLLTGENELTFFSLDAIYDCVIKDGEEEVKCNGIICERYYNKLGKIILFSVKNGFYKNTVN